VFVYNYITLQWKKAQTNRTSDCLTSTKQHKKNGGTSSSSESAKSSTIDRLCNKRYLISRTTGRLLGEVKTRNAATSTISTSLLSKSEFLSDILYCYCLSIFSKNYELSQLKTGLHISAINQLRLSDNRVQESKRWDCSIYQTNCSKMESTRIQILSRIS